MVRSSYSLPLRGRSASLVTPRRWQAQPARSTVGRIREGHHRSQNRTRVHPVRPCDIHKRMRRFPRTNGLLQPMEHLAISPIRAILPGKSRNTKSNGHVDSSRTHTMAVHTDELPESANCFDTSRNLLLTKLIVGNNPRVIIFHASHGANTSRQIKSSLLASSTHRLQRGKQSRDLPTGNNNS